MREISGNFWEFGGSLVLTGQYPYILEDKGRICLPEPLRKEMPGDKVFITKGIDRCLWLFSASNWKGVFGRIMAKTSIFDHDSAQLQRYFIGSASELVFDKVGRIAIPQSLREWAYLVRNVTVMGSGNRVEIWNSERLSALSNGENGDREVVSIAQKFGEDFVGFGTGNGDYRTGGAGNVAATNIADVAAADSAQTGSAA
jgi:MraZ protein